MADIIFPTWTTGKTPVWWDIIPLADSAAANALKETTVTDLWTTIFTAKSTSDLSEWTNEYYTEAKVSANTDVAANTSARHTHSNKATLDAITASYTTADASKLAWTAAWAASSTDNALARFDSTTGKVLQNWTITEDDSWNLANVWTINWETVATGTNTWDQTASTLAISLWVWSPTVDTQQEYTDNTWSSWFFDGWACTDWGGWLLDVAAWSGFIRATNDNNAPLNSFKWAASTWIAVTDNSTQYIFVDDTGTISLNASEFIEAPDLILIWVITKESWLIESVYNLWVRLDESIWQAGRFIRRIHGVVRDKRKGWLILWETWTRNITLSAWTLWWGRTEYPISTLDTSVTGNFDIYSNTTKVAPAVTQWTNTVFWDWAGWTTVLSNGRWTNIWFYIEPDDHLIAVYDNAQYNSEAAAAATGSPSTVPNRISAWSTLASRLTFQKNASTATIIPLWESLPSWSAASDHNSLTGLDWWTAWEYYHLTSAEYTDLENANALNSATTTVNVNSATAPTIWQVLTATSSTAATWQAPTWGTDADAIHDNVAWEIALITEKATPIWADYILIEDSAAGNVKKKVQVGNLPTAWGWEANTYSNAWTGWIGITLTKTGINLPFKSVNAASTKIAVTDDVPNSNIDIDVVEANLTLSNMWWSVTDAQVPNTITLDNITQITNRSHTWLSDKGTNTHAQIDTHIASVTNPHSVTKAQVWLTNVDDTSDATKNSAIATLTNKSVALWANTITWTKAEFNTAVTDWDVVFTWDDITGKSASTDALKSATTTINVSSATAPTVWQVLTATWSAAATWQDAWGWGTWVTIFDWQVDWELVPWRIFNTLTPWAFTATEFRCQTETLPVGASIVVNLLKNWTVDATCTIIVTETIVNWLYTDADTTFVSWSYAATDRVTVEIDSVWSTIAGNNLSWTLS